MEEKQTMLNRQHPDFWMRLDNAAKIYPAVQSEELTAVFRLSCILKDRIKIMPLLKAVQLIEDRFPYYKVKPKRGFFWYYLEHHNEKISVVPDVTTPCRAFQKGELIFRVLVKANRVSVEFSHILTDGSGAFEFLKTLLITYFHCCNISIPEKLSFLSPQDIPLQEEFEDAYSSHFQRNLPLPKNTPKSFHLPFTLNPVPRFKVVVAMIPLDAVSKSARQNDVSITVFLVSIYLMSLQNIYNRLSKFQKRKSRKIFRIQVPINLRKIFPSKTMRNFSLFVTPEIDLRLGQYTLEETLKTVHHLMQLETDKKLMNKIISRNVSAERNLLLKNTPLFIKSLILYFTYKVAGTSRYSGVITNLGKVNFNSGLDTLIDHFVFIPPPPNKTLKVNCGVLGFGNKLILSFGNITNSKELEREFFSELMKLNIPVKIMNY
ncbi:hypothetical protein [Chryseolinea sp. H1M3-3]|uniref:hypothetical protein n=1 Tax=Chryseolinea sp. H1M3-3 TaxID=3034144 RepID=UPI0023EB6111|nr:hypothetical protein [Chryseolinea sp. H1M3-3]